MGPELDALQAWLRNKCMPPLSLGSELDGASVVLRKHYTSVTAEKASADVLCDILRPMLWRSPHFTLPSVLAWGGLRKNLDVARQWGDTYQQVGSLERFQETVDTFDTMLALFKAAGLPYDVVQVGFRKGAEHVLYTRDLIDGWSPGASVMGSRYEYPACCIAEFTRPGRSMRMAAEYNAQLTLAQQIGAPHIERELQKYFFHVPCSVTCDSTITLARRYQEFTRRAFPELAASIEGRR